MASLTDFLFQGNPTPPQPTGSDTSTSYPLWLQQLTYGLGTAADQLAGQTYTPYPGQQVATPSPTTQQSWTMAGNNVGSFRPDLSSAEGLTGSAGTPVTASDISGYMNPYMDQVIGGIQGAANKNLTENILPGVQDKFTAAGQSRSPQEQDFTNRAIYNSEQASDQAVGSALSTGYQGALNAALAGKSQEQAAGAQFGQLGALNQQLGLGDVGAMAAAGQTQDTYNQSAINASLNNFYAQQQWPYQQLGYASNIIRGLPVTTNTQTVGQAYAPGTGGYTASPLSAFIGAAGGAKALGFAEGGNVTDMRRKPAPRGAIDLAMAA